MPEIVDVSEETTESSGYDYDSYESYGSGWSEELEAAEKTWDAGTNLAGNTWNGGTNLAEALSNRNTWSGGTWQ